MGQGLSERQTNISDRVRALVALQASVTNVALEDNISLRDDLGFRQHDIVDLVLALEAEFGVALLVDEIRAMRTVGDVVSTFVRLAT